jgi:signal transduction histidine kinase
LPARDAGAGRTTRRAAHADAELLIALAEELNQDVDLAQVIATALRRGVELLGGVDGALFLLEDRPRLLRGAREVWPRGRTGDVRELERLPTAASALEAQEPRFCTRADAGPAEVAWMEEVGVSASLVVPMLAERDGVGFLFVNYADPLHRPSAHGMRLARYIGGQCGLAIARARLYDAERVARSRAEVLEREAKLATERVSRLQDFTAALSSAVTMKDVARVLFEQGLGQFGAKAVGIVWMMRPGSLQLVFGQGVSEPEFRFLDEAARAGERLPIRDAILARRAVWLESPDEIRARYPVLESLRARRGESGCAVVPLVVGDRCPGVIGFTFAQGHRLSSAERSFVEALAQLSAQAFHRARLFEGEQEQRCGAERIGQLQEQLMAIVSHDLRTPLSAIRLGAGLLLQRGGLSPTQVAALDRIGSSAARMSAIVSDLLDLSRSRLGLGIGVRCAPVDLAELARSALSEFGGPDQEGRISLAVVGDTMLEGDEARLLQVISNLLGNALQHGAGEPVLVTIEGREAEVRLAVHNGGPPIPAGALPHIFEPFTQGGGIRPRQVQPGSMGLGLFIVREVVLAHGGSVVASSHEGLGTTFEIVLPRRPAAPPLAAVGPERLLRPTSS